MKTFLLFVLLIISTSSHACKFRQLSVEEYVKQADMIFIGTVQEAFDARNGDIIPSGKIHILNKYKGKFKSTDISLRSHNSSCGISFQKGQSWLILGLATEEGVIADAPSGSILMPLVMEPTVLAYIKKVAELSKFPK